MRTFLPTTPAQLALWRADGVPAGVLGVRADDGFRLWYTDSDTSGAEHGTPAELEEELEWAALQVAAQLSLHELAADPSDPRRVVVSLDAVADVDDVDLPGGCRLSAAVPWARVAAVHLDEQAAAGAVQAALTAVAPATAATPVTVAGDLADPLDKHELLWFSPEESLPGF